MFNFEVNNRSIIYNKLYLFCLNNSYFFLLRFYCNNIKTKKIGNAYLNYQKEGL